MAEARGLRPAPDSDKNLLASELRQCYTKDRLEIQGGEIELRVAGIAINADAAMLDGNLDVLRQELEYYAEIGFDHVEIAPHGAGVLLNGMLHREQMKRLLQVLSTYPFHYIAHGPNPMNLMNRESLEIEKRMFLSSLEFTAEIGSGMMVYHAGRWLPEEHFQLPGLLMPAPEQQRVMWDLERTLLQEMGALAEQHGVNYCRGERPSLPGRRLVLLR